MPSYRVGVKEIYTQWFMVEASNPQEAKKIAARGTRVSLELKYSCTRDSSFWEVEEDSSEEPQDV